MANTTSQSYSFDQNFSIDEIIQDAYERIGLVGTACLLYTSPSPRD